MALIFQNLANIRVRTDDNGDLIVSPSAAGSTFLAVDGSVGVPSYSFVSDPATGFLRTASGTLRLVGTTPKILFGTNSNAVGVSGSATVLQGADGGGYLLVSNGQVLVNSAQFALGSGGTADLFIGRAAAGQTVFSPTTGGAAAGGLLSDTTFLKSVAAIADNVATATVTVTIPNSAQSASLKITLVGSLGAGGAIGANEATGTVSYDIGIARTAGVNAVVTTSTAYGSGMANVAGAATITVTAAASAISGAVGAVNTFTVNVTIAHGSGSSTNHTCVVRTALLNANASGCTIA